MKLIVCGRGQGKTEELLDWLVEDPTRILISAFVQSTRDRLLQKLKGEPNAQQRSISQVTTGADFRQHRNGRPMGLVAVDDLDFVVGEMWGMIPTIMTVSCVVEVESALLRPRSHYDEEALKEGLVRLADLNR